MQICGGCNDHGSTHRRFPCHGKCKHETNIPKNNLCPFSRGLQLPCSSARMRMPFGDISQQCSKSHQCSRFHYTQDFHKLSLSQNKPGEQFFMTLKFASIKLDFWESSMLQTQTVSDIDNTATTDDTSAASAPFPVLDINQLYFQHRVHLLHFVQRYVRNVDDAEDVVQNTFMEAVRCADRFSGLSKPSTWLFGIALNLARNQVRRNAQNRYDTVDEGFMEQIIDPLSDPAMLVQLRQIASKVDALLNKLPPAIHMTFKAVLDGESTYEEAAENLQIPIGTVRSRVSRVRMAIRAECGNIQR